MNSPAFLVSERSDVTNTIAVVLGALVLGGLASDVVFNDTKASLFLAKKFLEFLEWIAFWR